MSTRPQPTTPPEPKDIWNGWTRNCNSEGDFIIHAFDERCGWYHDSFRSLCGVKLVETGMVSLDEGWEPGCIKCRNKLRKLGLMKPREPIDSDK